MKPGSMMEYMFKNDGNFPTPIWDDDRRFDDGKRHYQTFLQTLPNFIKGQTQKTELDQNLPSGKRDNADAKQRAAQSKTFYPETTICPHVGCYGYSFRSVRDSYVHEMEFYHAQRKQRLLELRMMNEEKPVPARKYKCVKCQAAFSRNNWRSEHQKVYEHQSESALTRQKNKKSRYKIVPRNEVPRPSASETVSLF